MEEDFSDICMPYMIFICTVTKFSLLSVNITRSAKLLQIIYDHYKFMVKRKTTAKQN